MARLTADTIVDAALSIVGDHGADALTVRRLGTALGADPTAIYRHFDTMDELLVAVGDRILDGVCDRLPAGPPERVIVVLCERLRRQAMARPGAAALIQSGPSLQSNERAITERLLVELARLGLTGRRSADAYHSIIELTVGAAVIDARVASLPRAERQATYERWRRAYRAKSATHPSSAAAADHLYRADADRRFRIAVEAMLRGLLAQ